MSLYGYKKKYQATPWLQAHPPAQPRVKLSRPIQRAKRVRPVSNRQWERNALYKQVRDRFMALPENKGCCVVNCVNSATDNHHQRGKLGSLLCDTRFFLPVCRKCHAWIDANRDLARLANATSGTNIGLPLLCAPGEWNQAPKEDAI